MKRLAPVLTAAIVIASLTPQVLAGYQSDYWQGRLGSLSAEKGKGYSSSSASMYNWGKGYLEYGKGKGKGSGKGVYGNSSSSRSRYTVQFSSRSYSAYSRWSRSSRDTTAFEPRVHNCRWKGDSIIEASFPGQIDYQGGWTFPVLIGGDCPVYTGILRVKENPNSPFGPLNW
jgi:hypothetical protein